MASTTTIITSTTPTSNTVTTVSTTAILPNLEELNRNDYEHVYEPSDDTFLLCDALEGDRLEIKNNSPNIALEIG